MEITLLHRAHDRALAHIKCFDTNDRNNFGFIRSGGPKIGLRISKLYLLRRT